MSSDTESESGLAAARVLFTALARRPMELRRPLVDRIQPAILAGRPLELLPEIISSLSTAEWRAAEYEISSAQAAGVRIVSIVEDDFPEELRLIADPPLVIFIRGTISSSPRLAIVGARRATPYGKNFAMSLAESLSAIGISVVSGLARGIDTAAHLGSLSGEAPTAGVAVLGCGVDYYYPPENGELAQRLLAAGGALISEYGVDTPPRDFFFPERNRIISALSEAVIVVEAELRSGALITARVAAEQGKEVFAVPGSVGSPMSRGTNKLIKDGAGMLTEIGDLSMLLTRLNLEAPVEKKARKKRAVGEVGTVLHCLDLQAEKHVDTLVDETGIEPGKLRGILSEMELDGLVTALPGGLYVKIAG